MITFIVVMFIYFLPAMVGYSRKVKNGHSVMIINLFFGITLVGWGIAMAMALRDAKKI